MNVKGRILQFGLRHCFMGVRVGGAHKHVLKNLRSSEERSCKWSSNEATPWRIVYASPRAFRQVTARAQEDRVQLITPCTSNRLL
jgi:hypothetical protein